MLATRLVERGTSIRPRVVRFVSALLGEIGLLAILVDGADADQVASFHLKCGAWTVARAMLLAGPGDLEPGSRTSGRPRSAGRRHWPRPRCRPARRGSGHGPD